MKNTEHCIVLSTAPCVLLDTWHKMSGFQVPDLEAAELSQEAIVRPQAATSSGTNASSFQAAFGFAKDTSAELRAADAKHAAAAAAATAAAAAAAAASNASSGTAHQGSTHTGSNDQRPLVRRGAGANLLVSNRQKGNPVLANIRQVAWEHADIKADYIMTPTAAAVFISVRYHLLNPQYVYKRMRELRSEFELRVLLIQVYAKKLLHQAVRQHLSSPLHRSMWTIATIHSKNCVGCASVQDSLLLWRGLQQRPQGTACWEFT